jgi:UDP-N-acetylmuramate--alanine ligase
MNIYFSGIGGVGLGPLAEIAEGAGHIVAGSDANTSLTTEELTNRGITVTNDQSGAFLRQYHQKAPIDWFVYTAALPSDHPELVAAHELGIRTGKRDELLVDIITKHGLKLIAIAGTHGKTTTTAMMVWVMQQLGVEPSYSIGSGVSFGPSGTFIPDSKYFVYECDEFDRNFLHFSPALSLVTSVDYDHPDTYPSEADYAAAFTQFLSQSEHVIMWDRDTTIGVQSPASAWRLHGDEVANGITLAGEHNRMNATLVKKACEYLGIGDEGAVTSAINSFPGTARRFERLADNLYSDYGHHPVEIAATLQMARELSDHVVLVYQPHQNTRQHEVRSGYTTCMELAEDIYWLPTYQSRENPSLHLLAPEELTEQLVNRDAVHYADMNEELWQRITEARAAGKLVLCMGAGSIDGWLRQQLTKPL